ncbi:unnamed protein product, partial [marine sediment metagenome]
QSKNDALNDLVHIGVDIHFKEPHMILVYTKLNGGAIYHIPANFKDTRDLLSFVRYLKDRYRTQEVTYDAPPHIRQWIDKF